MRAYYNSMDCCKVWPPHKTVCVPSACTIYPKQMTLPKYFSKGLYSNSTWTYMKTGGYYPACESPEDLTEDIQNFLVQFCFKT